MFGLLHGLYQHIFSKPQLNILILGLDHAGKTVSQYLTYVGFIVYHWDNFVRDLCLLDSIGANERHIQKGRLLFCKAKHLFFSFQFEMA